VSETGSPASRSSVTKPERRSSTVGRSATGGEQFLGGPLDVRLVLEQDVQGVACRRGVDRVHPEYHERARQSRVSETDGALRSSSVRQRTNNASDLVGELVGDPGDPGADDLALSLEVG